MILTPNSDNLTMHPPAMAEVPSYVLHKNGLPTEISDIDRDSLRSQHLSQRFGAIVDDDAERPNDCLVYRHKATGAPK